MHTQSFHFSPLHLLDPGPPAKVESLTSAHFPFPPLTQMADLTPRADRLRRRRTGQRAGEEDSDDTDRPSTPTQSGSSAFAPSRPADIPLPNDDVDETAELGGNESDSIASRDSSLSKQGSWQTTESADNDEKEGEEGEGTEGKKPLGRFSSMTQRIKSPLMNTLNLEELRESISKNVEGK